MSDSVPRSASTAADGTHCVDLTLVTQALESARRGRMNHGDLVGDLAHALRGAFISGEIPLGTKLSNEIVLAEQLKVSRPTLREALRILIHENYLESRRGVGTFVTQPAPQLRGALDTMRSLTDFIVATGAQPGIRDLQIRSVSATRDMAAALAIAYGAPIAHISRTRLSDGRPLAWGNEYLPLSRLTTLERVRRFDGASLYRFMHDELHAVLAHGELAITAIPAPRIAAGRLGLTVGAPLLLMREIVFGPHGDPVLLTVNHHNTAAAVFSLMRSGRPT